jgi:hypothetical protein
MLGIVPSVVALGCIAALAVWLTLKRKVDHAIPARTLLVSRALAVAIGIQVVHLGEEAATGFHEAFPAMFGLSPIPFGLFVAFNLLWVGIWSASVVGVRTARPAAYFAAWFLALAGIANGVAHPTLAWAAGGYFPGLITSPVIAVACYRLGRQLWRAAAPASSSTV